MPLEIVHSVKPLLAILVSLIGAVLVVASGRNPNVREFWSLLAGALKFLLVVSMIPVVWSGGIIEYRFLKLLPGVEIAFRVDGLGLLFATVASFLWILTTIYSIGYMRSLKEHAQTRYFACFSVSLSATMGVAFCSNLFSLFLFYEILTLVTYPLVIHKESPEAFAAGRKYMVYLLGSSKIFFLAAILLTYSLTGSLEFSRSGMFSADANPILLTVIYILFLAGLTKAGMMPLHNWLPTAMIAPTPVSALLHAVAVVKVGVFSIVRVILDVFGVEMMQQLNLGIPTAFFVSFTILVASVVALSQDNLKLRLAYSTVSQLSYVILGVALLTPSGITGGILQIANHAFAKITLFFCAGAIYVALHKTNVSELAGIAKRMPWTMLAFTIGSLSLIGVPSMAGFISKWYLAVGSIQANEIPILIVLLASTILNAAYFMPIIYKAYFEEPPAGDPNAGERHEAPNPMVIPLMITAAGTVLFGFFPDYFLALARLVIP